MATTAYGKGPQGEIGSTAAATGARMPGTPGWSHFMGEGEHVPDLRWPQDVRIYERMLTNPQVWALYMGMVLPLLDYDYGLEVGDADPAMTAMLAADLGLPVGLPAPGEHAPPISPGLYRFDFLQHLWEACMALAYGHSYFEQVGEVGDDGLWHLRRLAPRAQQHISDILTDDDGGLAAIVFPSRLNAGTLGVVADRPIPVDRLVAYVWLSDARRRWTGRAMLRACYEPFILRDPLVRIDVINHERAGGVPVAETDATWEGSDLTELQQMASAFRVGSDSGAATPPGATLKLLSGRTTDVVASIRYHDESMARAWGAMVRQLGQTMTGSRALGMTFADLEAVVRRSVMRWFCGTFREHVIEDWWAWNVPVGADGRLPPHPSLAWRDSADPAVGTSNPRDPNAPGNAPELPPPGGAPPDPPLARSPLASGRGGGAAGDRFRGEDASARDRERRGVPSPVAVGGRVGDHHRRSHDGLGVAAAARLPDRPLRREPFPHEIAAAVDFAAMDVAYNAGADAVESLLATDWLPAMIQQTEDAVTFTKTGTVRKRLSRLDAARMAITSPPVDRLTVILTDAAREGMHGAVAELAAQGLDVSALTDDALTALVKDQAAAVAQQTADGIRLAASRRAVQVNAGRTPGEVANEVSAYLRGLKHEWPKDQLRGAVQMATNVARLAIFAQVEQGASLLSSELLDANTCGPCAAIDGHEFADMTEAQRFYPTGGFIDCQGGPRCRGTVVLVLAESEVAPGTPAHLGPG